MLLFFIPFIIFLQCSLGGRFIGIQGTKSLSAILSYIVFFFTFIMSYYSLNKNTFYILKVKEWIKLGIINNSFLISIDKISVFMAFLVSFVSFCVHIYSISYMSDDPHICRFMSYLSLFTFFMLVLIFSNNLCQLFIGWEGVGICSYLLINFWFTRMQANKSAIKAVLINKIGDIGFICSIVIIWTQLGSMNYYSLISVTHFINIKLLNLLNFFFFLGIIAKSAQIGLHMWLPDAMEGPTPVSALIHAATMVTAGVFFIIRLSPFFEKTPIILFLFIFIGSFTSIMSAIFGVFQNDIKKVIAYSTCSQLGYMVLICGFSQYKMALFHLINHGFFKALLFLSAGSIIHTLSDEQDLRRMGNLSNGSIFTYICFFFGSLSLAGIPFLTGFYSKDLLIELTFNSHIFNFVFYMSVSAAFLTAFYSLRLLFLTFLSTPQFFRKKSIFYKEIFNLSHFSQLLLLAGAVFVGFLIKFVVLEDLSPVIIKNVYKFLPLILSILSLFIITVLLIYKIKIINIYFSLFINRTYSFFCNLSFIDNIINYYIIKKSIKYTYIITYIILDNQFLEKIGPTYISKLMKNIGSQTTLLHNGKIHNYIFSFILFSTIFIIFNYN